MASSLVSLISRKGAANWICRRLQQGCFASRMSTLSGVVSDGYYSRLPSKTSPWLMLPPAVERGDMVHKFYSLADNRVLSVDGPGCRELGFADDEYTRLVGSSHGWLALLNTRNQDVFLTNPLTGRHVKLPPIDNKLPIPEECLGFNPAGCVSNVIISCSPAQYDEDCRAMMICGPSYALAFCCPGRSTEWTRIGDPYADRDSPRDGPRCYDSCLYSASKKLFFCVTDDCDFEAWDLRDPHSPRKITLDVSTHPMETLLIAGDSDDVILRKGNSEILNCLVVNEKSGELFVVRRFIWNRFDSIDYDVPLDGCTLSATEGNPHKTIDFDVHKYDPESREFRSMDRSLDGLAFFLGKNHSFAISAGEFPELKPDSIYYTDALTLYNNDEYGGHDIGIFSYKDRTFSPCYYPCDAKSFKMIAPSPIWYTPSPL